MNKRNIRRCLLGISLFGLILFSANEKDVKKIQSDIPIMLADDAVETAEIRFTNNEVETVEARFLEQPSVLSEKIAVNPNYEYTNEEVTLYAKTDDAKIVNRPEPEKQVTLKKVEKREKLTARGYNEYNQTYKVELDGKDAYVNKDEFSEDLANVFDEVSGERYVSQPVLLKVYPSAMAEALIELNPNDQVILLGTNLEGFYKIKAGDTVGYLSEEYLSETKVNYVTDAQKKIADIARRNAGTYPCDPGYCAAWVSGVYMAAGYSFKGANAIDFWLNWSESGSTDIDNIPIGAVVVGSSGGGELGNLYGHVGIYIGDGMVAENIGSFNIMPLDKWAARQTGYCRGYHGYIGWVWPGNNVLGDGV